MEFFNENDDKVIETVLNLAPVIESERDSKFYSVFSLLVLQDYLIS